MKTTNEPGRLTQAARNLRCLWRDLVAGRGDKAAFHWRGLKRALS